MRTFLRFWWDFIVGDEPKIAAAVVVVLAVGAGAAAAGDRRWLALAVAAALVACFAAVLAAEVRRAR